MIQKSPLFQSHPEKEDSTVALFDATAMEFLLNEKKDNKSDLEQLSA